MNVDAIMSNEQMIQYALKKQQEQSIEAMKCRLEFIECLCKNLIKAGMISKVDGGNFISCEPSESWKKKFYRVWIEELCLDDTEICLNKHDFKHQPCSEFISVRVVRQRSYGCQFIIYVWDFDYYAELTSSDEDYLNTMSKHSLKLRKDFMKVVQDTIDQHNNKRIW